MSNSSQSATPTIKIAINRAQNSLDQALPVSCDTIKLILIEITTPYFVIEEDNAVSTLLLILRSLDGLLVTLPKLKPWV